MRSYSTYEAKARFSEVLRKVRGGESVLITYRGKEVAEIRPVVEEETIEEKLRTLQEQGVIGRGQRPTLEALRPLARRPGALQRFLESRD